MVNKQTNSLGKKITSLFIALVLGITSGVAGAKAFNKKSKEVDITSTTSVTTEVDNTEEIENNSLLEKLKLTETFEKFGLMDDINILEELKLLEDFDINDKEAVNKRAKQIYKISEKDICDEHADSTEKINTIVNLIYLVNEKFDSISFPNDMEGYEYIQYMFNSLRELLNDNAVECRKVILNDKYADPKYDNIVYSYMLMAEVQKNPNSTIFSKQDSIAHAVIVRKQLNNIKKGNSNKCSKCAEDYYNLYNILKNREAKTEKTETKTGYSYAFYCDFISANAFMTPYLSEEQENKLASNLSEKYNDELAGKVMEAWGIDKNKVIEEAIKSGDFGYSVPNYGASYKSSDAAVAKKGPYVETIPTHQVVEAGGKKVNVGTSEVIKTPSTTTVNEVTTVASIDETKKSSNKKSSNKETTKSSKKESTSGTTTVDVETSVATPITDKNKENTTTSKKGSTTTTQSTPTKANEEVIEEGGKVVDEFDSVDDAEDFINGISDSKSNFVDADSISDPVKTK